MEWNGSKTRKLVSLFVVTTLAIGGAGCTRSSSANECYDSNEDGYCDDDGSSHGSSYYYHNGQKRYTKASTGVSSGTQSLGSSGTSSSGSKSGIGSSSSSSGG